MQLLVSLGLQLLLGSAAGAGRPAFVESAAAAGVDFHHFNGMSGQLYFAEHMGGSAALFDYDNDGDLDLYLGQGNPLDSTPAEKLPIPPLQALPLSDRLFRNDLEVAADGSRRLRFTDVTEAAGLRATGYGMGVAVADVDNDGFVDLYITNLGSNQLWRNRGDGTFEETIRAAGADDRRWSVAASFFDYDGDRFVDLYVGNYVEFRLATHKNCASATGAFDYCGPKAYAAEPNRLLRNRGDGSFEDVTHRAAMQGEPGATLGTLAADIDGDGHPDLYVANDQMPNELWLNRGDGTFVDDALLLGVAVDGMGQPQASMGVVAGDLNGDGHVDLFMTHLEREMNTLYLNDGHGMFSDGTRGSGLGRASWNFTGFGTSLLDYDGDGILDLYVANGAVKRIEVQLAKGDPHPLRQTNQLFRGLGGGRFEEVLAEARERPVAAEVSRGLATGDLDNDGDPDLVVANNAGPLRLLINQLDRGSRWVGLRLVSSAGNGKGDVDGLGARARLLTPGAPEGWRRVATDGSYAAASDPRLLFALPAEGPVGAPDEKVPVGAPDEQGPEQVAVRVVWPDGTMEDFTGLASGRYTTLRRGAGSRVRSSGPGEGG